MAWTEQQQRAIELDGKNILVSAAAGSGKTAVLTERVTEHLMREDNQSDAWNVDELLIVTFTKAAAAEMSERIGKRLQQAISEELDKAEPDKKLIRRMEKQIILLSSASISTIDSFCQKIVKNNFAEIDLDPKFRVANDNELLLLKQDVLDELFEERYASEDDALLYLAEKYGNDRGDDNLYGIVLSLYEKAVNQPFPEHWLNSLIEDFAVDADMRLSGYHKWWQVIIEALASGMKNAQDVLKDFAKMVKEVDDKKARLKYDERLDRIKALVGKITAALDGEWQDIYDAFRDMDYKETGFLNMPGGKMDIDPELREKLKAYNAEIKDILGSLRSAYILDTEELMTQDLQGLSGDAAAIVDLTLGFMDLYGAAKREKNIIDYSDMEHFALQILLSKESSPEELKPSEAALALRRRYKEIMVDEYQDTNEVQNTIVSLIAGDGLGNLFTVGDVKQSIYGFRSSEPKLFMQKYESYGRETEEAETAHELITLGRNFRSRKEVLAAVNFVFAQLMAKEPMEID